MNFFYAGGGKEQDDLLELLRKSEAYHRRPPRHPNLQLRLPRVLLATVVRVLPEHEEVELLYLKTGLPDEQSLSALLPICRRCKRRCFSSEAVQSRGRSRGIACRSEEIGGGSVGAYLCSGATGQGSRTV
ncbi:uncharacterized protein J3R85_006523 [Psidium guajava]|nr:uncharacterized protein J3R85_006523 [Psidium guajava]